MQTEQKLEIREAIVIENLGRKLFGILHRPPTTHICPGVVIFHGFASHKIGRNRSYVKLAEALSQNGIAVLRFDFGGCGDSEGSLSDMTIHSLISDGSAAINFLKTQSFIDQDKIGIVGSSLGGAIAVLTSVLVAKDIKALCLWAPVASGELWYADWLKANVNKTKAALTTHHGTPLHVDFQDQFIAMNAAKAIESLTQIPLLLIHGEQDSVVSSAHREAYRSCRALAQAESLFTLIPNTDHFLGFSQFFNQIVQDTTHFFCEYLLPPKHL